MVLSKVLRVAGPLMVAGVVVASWLPGPPAPWALGLVVAGVLLWRTHHPLPAITGLLLLGGLTASLIPTPPKVQGPIRGEVVSKNGGRVLVASNHGRVWVSPGWDLQVGHTIAAKVRPERPQPWLPGDVSPRWGLGLAGAAPTWAKDVVLLGDAKSGSNPFAHLPHGAILHALTTGDRRGITPETRQLLRDTGTSHILAISGLHVGIITSFLYALAWLITRPAVIVSARFRVFPWVLAGAAAMAFALHVGASASAIRAASMAMLAAWVRVHARPVNPWALWSLAMAAMVLFDPGVIASLSFGLSFSAVGGILAVAPALTRLLPPDVPRWVRWLVASLSASTGAVVGTLPFAALFFQQLSPSALLANLMAVPAISVVVPAAFAAVLLPEPLGSFCALAADGTLGAMLTGLAWCRTGQWAPAATPFGAIALGLVPFLLRRSPASSAAILLFSLGLQERANCLRFTFLAVGQGDAVVVEWPDGQVWLVDGGPPSDRVLRYLRRRHIRHLDVVALSHPDADHLGGLLPVVEQISFSQLWVPRAPVSGEGSFYELWKWAHKYGADIVQPDDNPWAIHPLFGWQAEERTKNNESLVLRVQQGAFSALLTGDVETEAEAWLAPWITPATLVKVAHHGSRTSSTPPFVAASAPQLAVISVGEQNRFRHPALQVLAAWRRSRVLRTDLQGTVEVAVDDDKMRVRTWKGHWQSLGELPVNPPPTE